MNRDLKLISAALFTWALGEGLYASLVTLHLEELGATPAQIGMIMALYALAQASAMIPAGLATDHWGARRVMLGGWLLGLGAVAVMAGSTWLALFAAGLVVYGFSAWVMPPITSYVTAARGSLTPERALTQVFAAYSAGLVISPTVGGLVGERLGLRAPFALAAVFFAISTCMMLWVRPQAPRPVTDGRRYAGLMNNRRFLGLMALVLGIMFALWLSVPLAPNFLQAQWGITVSQVGLLGSAASLGEVALALFLGRRSPRKALVAIQAAAWLYLLILLNTGTMAWLALGFFFRAGVMVGRPFFDSITTRVVPPEQHGLAFASSATVFRIANMLAAGTAGYLYAFRPALPFVLAAGLIPLAAALTWLLAPRPSAEELAAGETLA